MHSSINTVRDPKTTPFVEHNAFIDSRIGCDQNDIDLKHKRGISKRWWKCVTVCLLYLSFGTRWRRKRFSLNPALLLKVSESLMNSRRISYITLSLCIYFMSMILYCSIRTRNIIYANNNYSNLHNDMWYFAINYSNNEMHYKKELIKVLGEIHLPGYTGVYRHASWRRIVVREIWKRWIIAFEKQL